LGISNSGAEIGGTMKLKSFVTIVAFLLMSPELVTAQEHPDYDRYEYRYIDGRFIPPYFSFPAGMEKGEWECFDPINTAVIQCSFIEGDLSGFKYIFKDKPEKDCGSGLGLYTLHKNSNGEVDCDN
jgi:hypothetical protein